MWLVWLSVILGAAVGERLPESGAVTHEVRPTSRLSGAYFGYAVQLTRDATGPRLLVGAPRLSNGNGGAFACRPDNGTCDRLPLGNEVSGQWLGAALDAIAEQTVVCAPRWTSPRYGMYVFMNGACYRGDGAKLLPLQDGRRQGYTDPATLTRYYYYAYGQAGMGVLLTGGGGPLLLGAPGVLQWSGTVVRCAEASCAQPTNPIELPHIERFSYLGYSLAAGSFSIDGRRWIAAGAPRGAALRGQVLLLEMAADGGTRVAAQTTGLDFGEYFGASLAAADITGDGLDDLLVGAPMYSAETGRVHVLVSDGRGNFDRKLLEAPLGGRYGSAVASLGDTDGDGRADIAIGAPYEEDGGAVYVHLGERDGVSARPQRRITAAGVRGLGISVSRGVDLDGNGVNDLAAGAFLSDTVLVALLRPAASVRTWISPQTGALAVGAEGPQLLRADVCLMYTGARAPSNLSFVVHVTADAEYQRTEQSTYVLLLRCSSGEPCCAALNVAVPNVRREYARPIELRTSCSALCNGAHCPVLTRGSATAGKPCRAELLVPYGVGCGADGICQPRLQLRAHWDSSPGSAVAGAPGASAIAEITIENSGEPAYLCSVSVSLNAPLLRLPSECQSEQPGALLCLVANPLHGEKTLRLELEGSRLDETEGPLELTANVSSVGEERDLADNVAVLQLPLLTQVTVELSGTSDPRQLSLAEAVPDDVFVLSHRVEARTRGPSKLMELQVELFAPVALAEPPNVTSDALVTCERQPDGMPPAAPGAVETLGLPAYRTAELRCDGLAPCDAWTCATDGSTPVTYAVITIRTELTARQLGGLRDARDIVAVSTLALVRRSGRVVTESQLQLGTVLLGAAGPQPDILPWAAAAGAVGLLLLAAATFALRKVGFFTRNRANNAAGEAENIIGQSHRQVEEEEEENEDELSS